MAANHQKKENHLRNRPLYLMIIKQPCHHILLHHKHIKNSHRTIESLHIFQISIHNIFNNTKAFTDSNSKIIKEGSSVIMQDHHNIQITFKITMIDNMEKNLVMKDIVQKERKIMKT